MAKEIIYLTAEGYKKLKDELDHMRSVERPAISAAIAEARDKGDLSENAEYDAAREAQGLLEMRIAKLEDSLANARVIDESKIDKSKVQILSKVSLLNHNTKKEVAYTIVAEHEATCAKVSWRSVRPSPRHCWGTRKATASTWRCLPGRSISRSSTSASEAPDPQGGGAHRPPPGIRVRGHDIYPHFRVFLQGRFERPFFIAIFGSER